MAVTSLIGRLCIHGRGKRLFPQFVDQSKGSSFSSVTNTQMWDFQTGDITGVGNVASTEAFGLLSLGVGIDLSGVASAEAIGLLNVGAGIGMTGIAGAEAFGLLTVTWGSLFKGSYKLHVELGITLLTRVFW